MDANDCRYTTIMQKGNIMNQRQAYNVEATHTFATQKLVFWFFWLLEQVSSPNKSPRFQLQDTNATNKANESKSCNSLVHTMSAGFRDFRSLSLKSMCRISASTFRSRWQRKEQIYEKKIRETPCISLHIPAFRLETEGAEITQSDPFAVLSASTCAPCPPQCPAAVAWRYVTSRLSWKQKRHSKRIKEIKRGSKMQAQEGIAA